jgi:hypothetical protein
MENVRPQHSLELPIVCKLNDDKRPHVTWGVEPFYGFCHYAARWMHGWVIHFCQIEIQYKSITSF